MGTKDFFTCSDGHKLAYNLWLPSGDRIKAFVQILHGMAEYSDRYEKFALFLNSKGIGVFAPDHRGHGDTANPDEVGWFYESNGWERVCKDAFELADYITSLYSVSTTFLLGHSMGSFLARTLMVEHLDFYSGVILSGTGANRGIEGKLGEFICKREIKKNGTKSRGTIVNKFFFKSLNKHIENSKTDFDWLSCDSNEVEKYIRDPKCGFICTYQFFLDLFEGIKIANDPLKAAAIPKDLPILIISGENDPVGNMGKGVKKVYKLYKNAGIADVSLKLLPNARHEILNEINKQEVYDIITSWIINHIS